MPQRDLDLSGTTIAGDHTLSVVEATPISILKIAVERGDDISKLTELMALSERYERNQAAAAFGRAITRFQGSCPPVRKARKANAGNMTYEYASLDDVMATIRPHLESCGIAVSFSTETKEKGSIRVMCRLRVGIHHEDYTHDVPVPDMRVNDTQKYGAALSYARRYALCDALNIVITDEDDDANGLSPGLETISEEQAIKLGELLEATNSSVPKFLRWLQVESLEQIKARDYDKAVREIKRKEAKP